MEIRAVPAGQAPAPAAASRYQIAAWDERMAHGAYVLDTHSGAVWHINEARRPKTIFKIGKVGSE